MSANQWIIDYYNTSTSRDWTGRVKSFKAAGSIGDGLMPILHKLAPQVALFSARGPNIRGFNFQDADLLKPDILAPGPLIWAAWSPNRTDEANYVGEGFAMGEMIALLHIPSDPLKKLHRIMGILEYHADYYWKVGMLPIFLYRLRFNATLKVMGTHVAITVNGSNCHFELNVFKSVIASGFPISIRDTYRDDGSTAPTAVLVGNHLYVANVEDLRGSPANKVQHFPVEDVPPVLLSHYNPYASTLEQPLSSTFSSNVFRQERTCEQEKPALKRKNQRVKEIPPGSWQRATGFRKEETTLECIPTWVVAAICTVIVTIPLTGSASWFSLALGLGRSSSPSDNKGSSATACTTMPSAKENEEESSINPELDFTLRLGNEQTPSPKKYADSSLKALELQTGIDLELSLSTGPAESDITSVHASSTLLRNAIDMPLRVARVVHLDEGSTSYPWKPGTSSSFPLIKPWKLDYILT
ncbi:Subtilisin-like protease SBT2.5 [Vitis vinifera]|uniref:Subtilisin-like protease SBT2.5 n=1 Tax=Vitis vinifera TaxID=29760 RepID=A0A438GBC0_VITVI|nr:Subtilisin-like protease SBT2.5 [Vitis vinifera]